MTYRYEQRRGHKLPENTKSVARPSRWGNPYVWREQDLRPGRTLVRSREESVARYRDDVLARDDLADWLAPLRGHDLACYCGRGQLCHGDVLAAILDGRDVGVTSEQAPITDRQALDLIAGADFWTHGNCEMCDAVATFRRTGPDRWSVTVVHETCCDGADETPVIRGR